MHNSGDTPWTVARQAPLSMAFPRQEYWSGWPFPPPGDLPTQGSNLCLLHLLVNSLPLGCLRSLNQVFNLSQSGMEVLLSYIGLSLWQSFIDRGAMRVPQNQDPHSWRVLGIEVLRSQRTDVGTINLLAFLRQPQGTGGQGRRVWVGETFQCAPLCLSDFLQPHGLKPAGSSVHGIFQVGTLEWVAISFSRGSS